VYAVKLVVLSLLLLLIGSAFAQNFAEQGNGGYAGVNSRLVRADDPFSRYRYFGPDYQYPFAGYGSKGSSSKNFGEKGTTSSAFNLDTSSRTPQGRNPARISNVDPNFRGYSKVDTSVKLEPFTQQFFAGQLKYAQATARLVMKGAAYGQGTNEAIPSSEVSIQTKNLLPLGNDNIYEAWLVDEDTEYALAIGFLRSGIDLASSLRFSFSRSLAPFDAVMITVEPFPDTDPRPGETILYGSINPARNVLRTSPSSAPETLR